MIASAGAYQIQAKYHIWCFWDEFLEERDLNT